MRNTLFGFLLASLTFFPATHAVARPDSPAVRSARDVLYEEILTEFPLIDNLSEEELDRFLTRYFTFFNPSRSLKPIPFAPPFREPVPFPLASMKGEAYYSPQVQKLISSENSNNRILAFNVLSATDDARFNGLLRKAMREDKERRVRISAGTALLNLRDEQTGELFDFLVAEEGYPYVLSTLYLELPPERLLQTAYEKSEAKEKKARILVVDSLIHLGINVETERLIRKFIREWEPETREYAIFAAWRLGMLNLAEILKPSAGTPSLQKSVMYALANSSSSQDKAMLAEMAQTPENLEYALNAYFFSSRPEAVQVWLTMICREKLPKGYEFYAQEQPLLVTDELHRGVLHALGELKEPQHLVSLLKTLKGRQDIESVERLVSFLRHPNYTVRLRSADTLEGVRSPLLVAAVPALLGDVELRTPSLTKVAITNRLDSLQKIYLPILLNSPDYEWRESAAEYLAVYPGKTQASVFRSLLAKEGDFLVKRELVTALAKFRVEADTDLIVNAMRSEGPNDRYAIPYLVALSTLKGERARKVVESYRNSSDENVRKLVEERLAKW